MYRSRLAIVADIITYIQEGDGYISRCCYTGAAGGARNYCTLEINPGCSWRGLPMSLS